jgi:hypothetical protein
VVATGSYTVAMSSYVRVSYCRSRSCHATKDGGVTGGTVATVVPKSYAHMVVFAY